MSMPSITHMQREIMAIPDAVDAMLSDGAEPIKRAAQAVHLIMRRLSLNMHVH